MVPLSVYTPVPQLALGHVVCNVKSHDPYVSCSALIPEEMGDYSDIETTQYFMNTSVIEG